jgi:hypothetical protein
MAAVLIGPHHQNKKNNNISARKSLKYSDLSGHWKSDLDVNKEEHMPNV